jgi:hypothetical protein
MLGLTGVAGPQLRYGVRIVAVPDTPSSRSQ